MSEKKKEEPQKREIPKQQEKTNVGSVIYLGPDILGVIYRGTVLNNGLTEKQEATVREMPALKMLFVPLKDAVRIRKQLKDKKSAASICYQKAAEYAKQKGEKG